MPASRRVLRSAAAVALATSATSLAYAGSAAPARAASAYNGYCTSSAGVTVVVDFGPLGGGLAIRCAPVGSGATGLQALQAAGIPVQGTQRYGLAFVCRIYGRPSSSTALPNDYHEQCVNTPPPNAYWSYSKAGNGGSWSVSSEGASSSRVIPGGFEGWSFNEGRNAVPRAAPTRPAPRPTSTAPAPPRHTTTTAPAPTPPASTRRSTPASRPSSTAPAKASSTHPTSRHPAKRTHRRAASASSSSSSSAISSTSSTSSSSSGPAIAAGGPPIADSDKLARQASTSPGVNATTVVGGGVLAALAIGAAVVSVIRRRHLR